VNSTVAELNVWTGGRAAIKRSAERERYREMRQNRRAIKRRSRRTRRTRVTVEFLASSCNSRARSFDPRMRRSKSELSSVEIQRVVARALSVCESKESARYVCRIVSAAIRSETPRRRRHGEAAGSAPEAEGNLLPYPKKEVRPDGGPGRNSFVARSIVRCLDLSNPSLDKVLGSTLSVLSSNGTRDSIRDGKSLRSRQHGKIAKSLSIRRCPISRGCLLHSNMKA